MHAKYVSTVKHVSCSLLQIDTVELDVLHLKPLMREKKLSNETKC